jgi:hypothetical protein
MIWGMTQKQTCTTAILYFTSSIIFHYRHFSKRFHHFDRRIGDTTKLMEGCDWFCCHYGHIFNFCGIFCRFCLHTFPQIFRQSCRIQHCTDTTIQCCSTRPLNCGVPGPVYSKSMPSFSWMHCFSNALFSPASSHRMVFTMCLIRYCWSDCSFFIYNTTCSGKWDFVGTNILHHIMVQSSSTIIQNFDLPKIGDCTKLILTINLLPGILLVFSVVLPTFH